MRNRTFVAIWAVIFANIAAHAAPELVDVFGNNAPHVYLDVADEDKANIKSAIDDFERCFKLITGSNLPISAGPALIPIQIHKVPKKNTGSSFEDGIGAGDCTIRTTQKAIIIEGSTDLALQNGFYSLLDDWGCRWFLPGDRGEVIPVKSSLNLPVGIQNVHISADPRILAGPDSYFPPEIQDWIRRNRFAKERTVTAHHHWLGIVPPSIYLKPHPEYFALIGDKRKPTQICTTNQNVLDLAINHADEYFAKRPDFDSYPLSPEDNVDFCQCPICTALDPKHKTPEGWTPLGDRIMTFANAVAIGIRDKHPGKLVGILAYLSYTYPPETVKPEPQIMVVVTRSIFDLLHLVPAKDGDSASQFYKLVESWKKLTPHVYTYEYNPIFWAGDLPCPNFLDYAQSIKDLLKLGSLGQRSDPGELPFRNVNNFVNDYMAMRVCVNADLEPKDILSDLCTRYFGASAQQMLRYYNIMSRVTDYKSPPGMVFSGGIRNYHKIFTPEMIAAGRKALDEAIQASGDKETSERIQMVNLGHQYLESYLEGVWAVQRGDFTSAESAFKKMRHSIEVLGAKGMIHNPEFILGFMDGARLMAYTEYAPDKIGMITNWKVLGPFDNSDRAEEERTEDPPNSIEASVKFNGQDFQWKDFKSKSGFIPLPNAFGEVSPQWNGVYGFLGVNLLADHETTVQLRMDSFNPYRIYLNGKEIFYRPGRDIDLPDKRRVTVTLPKGESTLIVKCIQAVKDPTMDWGFNLRIVDPSTNEPSTQVTLSTGSL